MLPGSPRTVLVAGALLTCALSALGTTHELAATRTELAPTLDGRVDEELWQQATVVTGFVQQRPDTGEAASASTEVFVLYDAEALYVGFVCHDSQPDQIRHKSLGRDADPWNDDYFGIALDTFLDAQNGYFLVVNPNGLRYDEQFREEGSSRAPEWDGIWSARCRISDRGWEGEVRIPWRTLRFPSGDDVTLGINFERQRRERNEQSHWAPVAREFNVLRMTESGRLSGLREIERGRDIVLRPFVLARGSRGDSFDDDAWAREEWEAESEVGVDLRAGVTSELTLDVTVNTDFAQVEIDDQEINLTRFPLYFPEKREFFLEKRDLFVFGSPGNNPFFSRRIGLDRFGETVPIQYGTRLTGKVGRTELGLLDMVTSETDAAPERRFDVVRISRDLGTRSRVGAIGVFRTTENVDDLPREEVSRVGGLDASLRPTRGTDIAAFGAIQNESGTGGDDGSWGARARWTNQLWILTYFHESVGQHYDPKVGFVGRPNVDQDAVGWEWTPEPGWKWIRRFENYGQLFWVDRRGDKGDSESGFETRYFHIHPTAIGQSDQLLGLFWETSFERLYDPFQISDEISYPTGDYEFSQYGFDFNTDPSRSVVLLGDGIFGDYFDGTQRSWSLQTQLRWAPHWRSGIEYERDHIERGEGELDSHLMRLRLGVDVSNSLRLDLYTQWASEDEHVVSQLRAHWLFGDESDLFFVVGDERADDHDDFAPRKGEWTIKLNYSWLL